MTIIPMITTLLSLFNISTLELKAKFVISFMLQVISSIRAI